MTTSRQQLLEGSQISDQEALVKLLIPDGPRIIKRIIPGGKTLLSQVGASGMEGAIFNWLRGCPAFTEVKLCWAKNPEAWNTTLTKVHAFDTRDPRPIWEREYQGRKNLAKTMATYVTKPFVFMQVKHDGIYIAEDKSGKFKPYITLTTEHLKLPEFTGRSVGERVPSPDWEPYVEYVAQGLGRYTNIQRHQQQ